jgi:uncharacterized protein
VNRIVDTAHPWRIILFGSAARGDFGTRSDRDVLIVVTDGTPRRKTARVLYGALAGFLYPVDSVVAIVSDMEKYRNTTGYVYREALREGIELDAA